MKSKNEPVTAARLLRSLMRRREIGTIIPLVIMVAVVTIVNPAFLAIGNIIDIFRTATYSFIVAVALTFLMVTGGMDLSIGAVTSLGGIVCGFALVAGLPIPLSILCGILSGVIVGFIKAFFVIGLDLPPFIVTLGVQYAVNGLINVLTEGMPISGFPKGFKSIGQNFIVGRIYYTILIAVAFGIIFHIVLTKTKYGRRLIASDGNAETAYLAGIHVKRIKVGAHVLVSTFAAIAGVLMASRFASAMPNVGSGTELTIMASVIIGGTSTYGGCGSIIGTSIGCLLLAVIANGLVLMRVSSYYQNLIFGLILLLSIVLDKYRQRLSENKK